MNEHISMEHINLFHEGKLTPVQQTKFLNHISICDSCAELLMESTTQHVLITAPSTMKDEIISQTRQLDLEHSKRTRLLQFYLYSLKVGFGVSAAIMMLFLLTLPISNVRTSAITTAINEKTNSITSQLSDFTNTMIKTEDLNYEK